ncbi:MAG: HEAT repeat domain-containing protein [Candidatus Omnitrophica bacterium]|nr:HEAT repeat domain-containing protein [Candidatus Omnitrophota bacterium]
MKKIFSFALFVLSTIFFLSVSLLFADEVKDLVKQTESQDFNTWYPAFKKLGTIKDSKAVDALIGIMKNASETSRREYAVEELYNYEGPKDPRAVDPLIEVMKKDSERMVRAKAAYALGEFKAVKATAPLMETLNDTDSYVREQAAEAIGKIASGGSKDEKAFNLLLNVLQNDSVSAVRDSAALGLAGFKDSRAVDPLIRALKDQDYLVRAFSCSSLGSIGDKKAIDAIKPLLNDSNETARQYAATALRQLGVTAESAAQSGDARGALTQYLGEISGSPYNWESRRKVIDLVAKMDPKPVISEEAQKAMARGKVEFANAQNVDQWEKAANEFQAASNLAPWWPDAYFNLALVQEKQLLFTSAMENFKLYLQANPKAQDSAQIKEKIYQLEYKEQNKNKAYDLVQRAADLQNAQQGDQAIPLLKEAITLLPDYYLAHSNLGRVFESKDQFKDALPELKEGIRLGDKDLGTYFSLAYSYEKGEENVDAAIGALEEGLRLNPYYSGQGDFGPLIASVYRNLGCYYEKKSNYKIAIEYYQKAISSGHTKSGEVQQDIDRIKPYTGN